MAYYNWNDKKQQETKLIIEGVDMNNREEVEKKFAELKRKKKTSSFFGLLAFLIIFVVVGDFVYVNFFDGTPILALREKLVDGIKYKGLGYEVLVCDNGDKYLNEKDMYCDGTISETGKEDIKTYKDVLHASLLEYFKSKKIINDDFKSLEINSYTKDEELEKEGIIDYFVDINYECKNDNKCLKTFKDTVYTDKLLVYVAVNKSNKVVDVFNFKKTGIRYNELVSNYTEKVKNYMINNNLIVEENLRSFKLDILSNKGKYIYEGVTYADSYGIKVSYMCLDNNDNCVTRFEDENNNNLTFDVFMFVNESEEVMLLESVNKLNRELLYEEQ